MLGWAFTIFAIFGSISGIFTIATMRFYKGDKPWSEKERVERVAKIHRIFGYLMLLFGNITIATGLSYYFKEHLERDDYKNWAVGSLWGFNILVLLFEVTYRLRNKYSKG